MKTLSLESLTLPFALAALAAAATRAPGAPLILIPTVGADTVNEARAITADGKFVVGFSGPGSISGDSGNGFLYPVETGALVGPIISSDGAVAKVVTGVTYRSREGQPELVVDGWSGGWRTEWMTPDGGVTWGGKRRSSGLGATADNAGPAANSVAGSAAATPDVFYTTLFRRNVAGYPLYLAQCSGPWPAMTNWSNKGLTSPAIGALNGVSANGRAVGMRNNKNDSTGDNYNKNYMLTWNGTVTPTAVFFNGLDGTQAGQAFAVSADGNIIFGQSPVSDGRPGNWGYKVVNPGASQTIAELPTFPDTGGSASLAVPYGCTPEGGWAVGMCYRATERAVLWDTRDPDPANWLILDLTEVAAFEGTLGRFTRLTRAYSVGLDATGTPVIAGIGVWSDGFNNYTRAFVMPLSPPVLKLSGSLAGGFTFSFQTLAGKTYSVVYKTDLAAPGPWTTVAGVAGNGSIMTVFDGPGLTDAQRFYRLQVE